MLLTPKWLAGYIEQAVFAVMFFHLREKVSTASTFLEKQAIKKLCQKA